MTRGTLFTSATSTTYFPMVSAAEPLSVAIRPKKLRTNQQYTCQRIFGVLSKLYHLHTNQ
uniref:Uncharacterized protein MANES_13G154900 n=1 Tax=Rhizophora mucronata TaxID=61149 RepID=A0A2P2MSC7_RHIMU